MAAPMKEQIESFVSGSASEESSKEIAIEINNNNGKFLEFMENLGNALTNTDNVVRGRATKLIGDVVRLLPPSFLSSDQVEFVVTFLMAKLSDHHSVQPQALQTLSVLTSRYNPLPKGVPQLICRSIFREVQNQSLSQSDRFATYSILQNILGCSFKDVEEMGGDFVIGFIQQIDSEKDPRNLMIVFNCAHFVSSNINLGPFTEEMFEVLGCYFPIDFTPPPNNPHGITKNDLVIALRKCFASTVDFAPFCVPLLVEKMTSDLQSARLDAFLTLTEAAPVYGRNGISEFLGSIVSCVKREVLMNVSSELVEAAKACLVSVFTAMSPKENVDASKDDALSTAAVELYQDVCKFLDGSDISKGCLAASLCCAVASSSSLAFCAMAPLVLPGLIQQTKNQSQLTAQLSYLTELMGFVQLLVKFSKNTRILSTVCEQVSCICDVLEKILNKDGQELHLQAVQSLSNLCQAKELGLSDEDCVSFLKLITSKALHLEDDVQRKIFLANIHNVVLSRPNVRSDVAEFIKCAIKSGEAAFSGEALVATATDVDSFTDVNNFFLDLMSQKSSDLITVKCHTDCLGKLLSQHFSDSAIVGVMLDKTVCPLVRFILTNSCQWNKDSQDEATHLLEVVRNIMRTLGCSLHKGDVIKLWEDLNRFFLQSDSHGFGISGDFPSLAPLQCSSPWQQTRLVALLEGFVEGVNIQWIVEKREAVFESSFSLALSCKDEFSQAAACKIVASMANKAPLGSQIHWFLEPIIDQSREAMSSSHDLMSRQRVLSLWIWLTKALECRSHSAASNFSIQLISLVSEPELGPAAAQGLGQVLEEDKEGLFKPQLHGTTSPLYRQRFFTIYLKHILEGFQNATSQEIKQNYLTAICSMTSHLSLQVLKPHLSKLVPLLLLSLEQTSGETLSHTLLTLSAAVTSEPDVIVPHLESIVSSLLKTAHTNKAMGVRISALKCLESLTSLDIVSIGRYQKKVVKELSVSLDDRKRLVRKQAVETRAAWILLEDTNKS